MSNGLSINNIVNVNVNLQVNGAGRRNFGIPLILGSSDVLKPDTIMDYTSIDEIAGVFGVESEEYKASSLFFAQSPRPSIIKIGRYLKNGSASRLLGIEISSTLEAFKAINDGAFNITVDSLEKNISGLNFADCANFQAVASKINELGATNGFSCIYDANFNNFIISTLDKGANTSVSYATNGTGGTDISFMLGLTENQGGEIEEGRDAETPSQTVANYLNLSNDWYFLAFAELLSDEDNVSVASLIEASTVSRLYFYTTQNKKCLDIQDKTNIGYKMKEMNFQRTCGVYSSKSKYACVSFIGRGATVNFSGINTMITMKFKRMVGVPYEELTESGANALKHNNLNVYVLYNNDTAIIQEGTMANGYFFDEVFGLDWFKNALEVAYYNMLYSSNKIPQTDAGMTLLINTCNRVAEEGVANGFIAGGIWNGDSFGQLKTGDYMPSGYYFYADSFNNQDPALREKRYAMAITGAIKLAGAIHFGDIQVNVNR